MIDDLVLAPWSIGANDGGVVRIRRDLHADPELGHLEYRSAAKEAAHLTRLGYAVKAGPEVMVAEAMLGAPTEAAMPQPAVRPADSVRLCGGISLIETVCGDGHRIGWLRWSCEALTRTDEDPMTERSLPPAELLAKAGNGDLLRQGIAVSGQRGRDGGSHCGMGMSGSRGKRHFDNGSKLDRPVRRPRTPRSVDGESASRRERHQKR